MGRSVPGGRVGDNSGLRNRTLHSGPVFESSKPGGVRGYFYAGADSGTKIRTCILVAAVCSQHAPTDVGIPIFILCLATADGCVELSLEQKPRSLCGIGTDHASCAGGNGGISRSCSAACKPLHPKLAMV